MYAFRKPFTAATFDGESWLGVEFKIILVTSQVMGYALSKFIGIRVVSELGENRRALVLVLFILLAEVSLILFGVTARPWNFVWMFFNGLPLGMIFGLVLRYLEGRRNTELLTSVLCISFITADGFVKSVGRFFLDQGVPEDWMPAVAGGAFFPFLLVFAGMLSQIPLPNEADQSARSQRVAMNAQSRKEFFHRYGFGLILLVVAYTLVTILRSIRADFAPEIWKALGVTITPQLFSYSEVIVSVGVLLICGSVVLVTNNRTAFFLSLAICLLGFALLLLGNLLLHLGMISPFLFMVVNGLGLYLPYIAVHTTLFERLIAMTRDRGNLGYLMYLADAFGYLGYVIVMVAKNFLTAAEGFADFYTSINTIVGFTSIVFILGSGRYFLHHQSLKNAPSLSSNPADTSGGGQ